MLSNNDIIRIQAEDHFLIQTENFESVEEYVLYLIHIRAYQKALELSQDKTVIDIGCNVGFGTHFVGKKAKKIVGIDVSKKAITSAKKNYPADNVDFLHVDGKTIPFADNSFDIAISYQVIEHIADYDIYIHEIKRVLKPQGIVLFTTPNAKLRLLPGMKPWNPFHVKEFTHIELETLLKKYFPEVNIQGLTGKEKIYNVEYNRLQIAKERHRKNITEESNEQQSPSFTRIIPSPIKNAIKKLLLPSPKPTYIEPSILDQYNIEDLLYTNDNLDKSLDLLAICKI